MKSPLKKSIGEVVTDYGARVMKVFKKGLLQRSLFDFYGDVKADKLRVKESASVPATPIDGDGGVMYTKSADGKLYYKSNEVAEIELSASDTVLTSEQVQDIVGAMVDGGTETNIAVTYDDSGGKLNFVSTDTNTTYSEATGSAEGLMSIAHHDKLDGIESSADVTDATNVTAAGALMDSELTDLAGVKGVTISTLQVKPSEGAFANGDKTKLDGIAAGATVDQTNVTGSSGSCTGNAATATALTSGDKTISGDLTVNGDSITFESANSDDPIFTLKNTSNDSSNATQMIFVKDRGVAPAVGTNIGEVRFVGEDSGQNSQEYGGFLCEIDVATNGQESGQFGIWVATHDGELQYGLQLTGGSEEDEVDVSIGQGVNSVTTIAGNLSVTGNVLPGITYVKILPSDFMPDDGGRPAMIDDTGSDRWLESHGTLKLFAFVDIPVGFKATHVDVYGSATSAVTVYEADVNSKTVTSKGTGNIGTQINITDVNSDATNYIMIELAQASGEEVYGGKLTIAKI